MFITTLNIDLLSIIKDMENKMQRLFVQWNMKQQYHEGILET